MVGQLTSPVFPSIDIGHCRLCIDNATLNVYLQYQNFCRWKLMCHVPVAGSRRYEIDFSFCNRVLLTSNKTCRKRRPSLVPM